MPTRECPFCKSNHVIKDGFRKNKRGKKQKFQCIDCSKYFVKDDGFKWMHNKPETITRAVHQHIDGFSLSKVQNHLWQHDNVKVSRWTIAQWVKKFSIFFRTNKQRSKAKNKRKNPFR